MKLIITQSVLAELLETAKNGISTRPVDPILGSLLIEASDSGRLTVIGTDLNVSIKTTAITNIIRSGVVALNAKLLVDTVNNLGSGELDIEVSDRACVISHSTGKCRIIGGNPEDFPSIPETENPTEISIPSKKLQAALEACLYCSSADETKLILTGVHFQLQGENWSCASTDGHRLAFVSSKLERNYEPLSFTVPRRSLTELGKILATTAENNSCTLKVANNTIQFILPNAELTSRLLEGEFPRVNNLIPRSFANELIVERKGMEIILKRISHFAEKKHKIVKILWEVNDQQATLMTGNTDIGDAVDSLLMKTQTSIGENIGIGVNSSYLQEALKHISTDEILFRFNKPLQPVIISPVGGLLDQLTLIMPVDVQDFDKPENLATTSKPESETVDISEQEVSNETTNIAETSPSDTASTSKSKSRKRKQEAKPVETAAL
ncbi:DNA polymerase III subunit beta [Scytonema hofmannii FACHB-248]|uniref:DNA polymerase III subunit beta n=1 Tax=Scytonema hofmannii FACHB-248 TaxID=1842502 RepID=A0ABR8GM35_9CYAN|nr:MULTISPECIES: DNA polymerase III subunit beta [Nostocales]MBD2604104.1 DNA polymerase III subunit beta [Scytonema hofmannii FACHB-248]